MVGLSNHFRSNEFQFFVRDLSYVSSEFGLKKTSESYNDFVSYFTDANKY